MSKIEDTFKVLRQQGRKALITFVTAGDPTLAVTGELVREMERRGADIIELGIPYSDPIAEGPVIQKADARALKNHITIRDVMETVGKFSGDVKTPLVYLLYYNCILQYGPEKFFQDCVRCGISGLIIPDLPFEERDELDDLAAAYPVELITMVSPTSHERMQRVAAGARGFLYCVSSLGVTGVRENFNTDFQSFFNEINRATSIPKALGFGISTPEHVQKLKGYCDGLIVGSAIVRQVEESRSAEEIVQRVGDYVAKLRQAMDED